MSETARQRADQWEPEAELPTEDTTHPGVREYVKIAVALAFVTLLEVAAYYAELGTFGFDLPRSALVALLIIMMVIKFALVVLWFMHLRFDSPLYKRLFLTGLALALSVFLIVLLTFGAGFLPTLASVGGTVVLLAVFLLRRRSHA
jgi:cytochrome c oxidase subunit 4